MFLFSSISLDFMFAVWLSRGIIIIINPLTQAIAGMRQPPHVAIESCPQSSRGRWTKLRGEMQWQSKIITFGPWNKFKSYCIRKLAINYNTVLKRTAKFEIHIIIVVVVVFVVVVFVVFVVVVVVVVVVVAVVLLSLCCCCYCCCCR